MAYKDIIMGFMNNKERKIVSHRDLVFSDEVSEGLMQDDLND